MKKPAATKATRSQFLTARVTEGEHAKIAGAAERAGLTVGSYVRQVLVEAPVPRQGRRPPIERKELARLLGELGHIGSNLNQLARAANSNLPITKREIQRTLADLSAVRVAILTALGREP